MGPGEGHDAFHGNRVVTVAEVGHHRHFGLQCDFGLGRNAAAVIRHRSAEAVQRAGSAPGEQTAPAKTNNAHLGAAGFGSIVNRRLNILHDARTWQRPHSGLQRDAFSHAGFVVAQINAWLDALKRGGRDSKIALRSKTVCHVADVRVDTENFLQHDHCAFGLAIGLDHIGRKAKAVGGGEFDKLTHGVDVPVKRLELEELKSEKLEGGAGSGSGWQEFALKKIKPVLAPENLAVQHIAGCAKNAVVNRLPGVGIVLRLHGCIVRLCQSCSVQSAAGQQAGQRDVICNVALVRPHRTENRAAQLHGGVRAIVLFNSNDQARRSIARNREKLRLEVQG